MKLPWDSSYRHEKADGYFRERSNDLYHTARWTRLARAYKDTHPLCVECQKQGRITPATCVDHIVPFPICREYFFDTRNLQALCDQCNNEKGQRDKKQIEEWKVKNR